MHRKRFTGPLFLYLFIWIILWSCAIYKFVLDLEDLADQFTAKCKTWELSKRSLKSVWALFVNDCERGTGIPILSLTKFYLSIESGQCENCGRIRTITWSWSIHLQLHNCHNMHLFLHHNVIRYLELIVLLFLICGTALRDLWEKDSVQALMKPNTGQGPILKLSTPILSVNLALLTSGLWA